MASDSRRNKKTDSRWIILLIILLNVAGACTCIQVRAAGLGSHTRLALQLNKAKKSVSGDDSYIKRANCVGAVGYAVVLPDERVPPNDFFRTDIRFRVRLRCVATSHVDCVIEMWDSFDGCGVSVVGFFDCTATRVVAGGENVISECT